MSHRIGLFCQLKTLNYNLVVETQCQRHLLEVRDDLSIFMRIRKETLFLVGTKKIVT